LRILRAERISLVDGIGFISDGTAKHSHLNKKTPWKMIGKDFDLDTPNPKFYKLFKIFLETFIGVCLEVPGGKKADMEFAMIGIMGFGYNLRPFRYNIQGIYVNRIWDEEARPYQQAYFTKLFETYREVYGPNYKPPMKYENEFAHGGSCTEFHKIGSWVQEMIENVGLLFSKIWRFIIDRSHSDGTMLDINEVIDCPKPGCCPVPDKKHGSDAYNHRVVKMSVIQECHGISVLASIEHTGVLNIGGWRKLRCNQDGSFEGNSQWNIPGTEGRQGDPDEVYEMFHYMCTEAKRQNKMFIYGMMELKALWKKNLLGKWVCPKP